MAPVQVSGPVLTVRRVDAYHALTMVAPAIATEFRPGHYDDREPCYCRVQRRQ